MYSDMGKMNTTGVLINP